MADDTKPAAMEEVPAQGEEGDKDKTLDGTDIANVLNSEGPVVTCVVLRAPKRNADESKKPAAKTKEGETDHQYLVEELEIDTTPQKNEVEKLLGGPITFVGQYDEGEGIVLMALRGLVEQMGEEENDYAKMTISQLRAQCLDWNVSTDNMVEKQDLVDALKEKEQVLPLVNPHKLQPPLQNVRVRGDILILKVAEVEDDSVNDEEEKQGGEEKSDGKKEEVKASPAAEPTTTDNNKPNSGEFFLPYTKEEYLKFAARTDIVAKPITITPEEAELNEEEGEEEENNDDDDDDENDEDFNPGEEEMTEEEEKSAMLNIVMSELLRKFRSDNGRGADSQEVLEIRASVAEQIGMEVVTFDEATQIAQANVKKRAAAGSNGETDNNSGPARKRVKFNGNLVEEEPEPTASAATTGGESQVEATEASSEKQPSVASAPKQEDQGSAKSNNSS